MPAQQIIPAATPELRGIRMDVEITEYEEGAATNVYDIEPHLRDGRHLPRHNRYYQAKIDGRYVKRLWFLMTGYAAGFKRMHGGKKIAYK